MFNSASKILIIDDMKTMRKLVAKALKDLGFLNVIEAEDGIKGWELLSASGADFNLVLSDWNMPNCTGIDLLKRVRGNSLFGKLPFVLLTAESEKSQVAEALKAGATGYIVKPFSTETLRLSLTEVYKKAA